MMSNNLPHIYSKNIFKKFINYLRNLFFFKKKHGKEGIAINEVSEKQENLKNNFLKDIKIDSDAIEEEVKKKRIMDNLKDNLQLLEEYSNEKLEKILQYYLKENEEKKNILRKLNT